MIGAMLRARSLRATLTLTAVAVVYCAAWPGSGIVVEVWFGHPPRGINSYELAAAMLAIMLPIVALNPLALAEHDALGGARLPLVAHGLALLALPLAPFLAFYCRVQLDDAGTQLPGPAGMVITLLVYSSAATIAIRVLGRLAGAALFLALYAGIVLAQHYVGPDWLGGAFATATHWQVWEPLLIVVLAAVLVVWRTQGTMRRRLLILVDNA